MMPKMDSHALTGLRRVFNKPDLDVDKFISKVSKNGGSEIRQTLTDLNKMSEEASAQMKKAIFNNFTLFIDAGKAVTSLGTTMHQLDNLLIEQKRLCSSLMKNSLFRIERSQNDSSKNDSMIRSDVPSLLNAVEGVSNLVKDSTRQLLFDVDAIEVNSITHMKQEYVHLFVLTDYVLVAKRLWDSFEGRRYRKQALYEIENIAAVSVKTQEAGKTPQNLIKLLVFPDVRVFRLDCLKDKRALISAIDEAKRLHVADTSDGVTFEASPGTLFGGVDSSVERDAPRNKELVACSPEVETSCFEALAGTIPEIAQFMRHDQVPLSAGGQQNRNPFQQDSLVSPRGEVTTTTREDVWLWEIPEDVDVAVAIRSFAEATHLITKARRRLDELLQRRKMSVATAPDGQGHEVTAGLTKLKNRVEQRASNLSIVLEEELIRASDMHGASQSVRAAVLHLSELGKTVLALHLFLAYRSGVMSSTFGRGVRQEGNQLVYLNRLSLVFHRGLVESVAEWNHLIQELKGRPEFQGLEECVASKLCSWVLEETELFCSQLRVVLIESRSISFAAMACASERIHAHSQRVTELIGMDVKSTLDNCLLPSWQRAVEEQGRVYRDAVSHRASKEIWQSSVSGSSDANVNLLLEAGFPEAKTSISGGRCLSFTAQNSRSLSQFAQACSQFDCIELKECFVTTLANMLRGDYDVYAKALDNHAVMANLHFFVKTVIPKLSIKLACQDHLAMKTVVKDYKKLLRETQQ